MTIVTKLITLVGTKINVSLQKLSQQDKILEPSDLFYKIWTWKYKFFLNQVHRKSWMYQVLDLW